VRATSHTKIKITKDVSTNLIGHARSRLLWMRSIKSLTHIGCKGLRRIKVLIIGISLLKGSRRVALSFLRTRRGRSLVRVKCFLHILHKFLKFLPSLPLLMKSYLNSMVRVTHSKQKPIHLLDWRGGFFTLLGGGLPLVTSTGLTDRPCQSTRFCCSVLLWR
jgi:hypothetical protein